MTDSVPKNRQLVRGTAARDAQEIDVARALGSLISGIPARARIRVIQDAKRHAKEMAELIEVAAGFMGTVARAQDLARQQTVRQELSTWLHRNEVERQLDREAEEAHQRALAARR